MIGEVGYADASVERIAHSAGLAKGTVYLYFKSRESLLESAFERSYEELMARTRSGVQRARGAEAKLAAAARAFLEHSTRHRAFYGALLGSPVSHRVEGQIDAYVAYLARLIDRGIRAGGLRRVNARRAAHLLVEMLRGTVADRLRDGLPPRPDEDLEQVLDLFLHGVSSGGSQ